MLDIAHDSPSQASHQRANVARTSLVKRLSYLAPAVHDDIVRALVADGIIADGVLHAAAARTIAQRMEAARGDRFQERNLRAAVAHCRRLGLTLQDNDTVSFSELESAMRQKNLEPAKRIEIKTILAQAGLID